MMIVLLAEHVLMSVRLKLSQKEISTKLIRMFAPIVVPVLMFARLKLFIPHKYLISRNEKGHATGVPFFFFTEGCI